MLVYVPMKNSIGLKSSKFSAIFGTFLIVIGLTSNIVFADNSNGNSGNAYGFDKDHGNSKQEVTLVADSPDNNLSQHPSGNDRNEEKGKSGTQGKSESNPDGGGADKRKAASDGAQGSGDWDDNNGCGNDNDFADDNRGNCGGKPKPSSKPKPSDDGCPKDCNDLDPSPSPSPTPNPTPTPSSESSVLGAISKLPDTGLGNLLTILGLFAMTPVGVALSRYKKVRKASSYRLTFQEDL